MIYPYGEDLRNGHDHREDRHAAHQASQLRVPARGMDSCGRGIVGHYHLLEQESGYPSGPGSFYRLAWRLQLEEMRPVRRLEAGTDSLAPQGTAFSRSEEPGGANPFPPHPGSRLRRLPTSPEGEVEAPLASRPGFPLQGRAPRVTRPSRPHLGREGAMPVRFEHRHLEGTAAMAAPAAARILGVLLLIRP
jgi:hypothetical protein